ncbi:hypothetical protein RPSD_19680 [Ralstonia solanacearum]|nr:hypothetical protein RPSD_19680 [Ralstonia solanacearum]
MANVSLKLMSDIEIGNVDHVLTVQSTGKKTIGKLTFSKGGIEWWPKGHHVNAHKFKWEVLAEILANNSTPVRVVPAKKRSKNAAKKSAKGTAKPTVKRNGRTKPDTKA